MCCLLRRKRPSPPAPPPRKLAPRHGQPSGRSHGHGHDPASSSSTAFSSSSSSAPIASTSTSITADFSSSSAASVSSVKDLVAHGPFPYRFRDICAATANFSPAQQIGRSVWKASLHGSTVAISRKQQQHAVPSIRRTLRHIHSLHHREVVRLLGACREGENLYLVYEFMDGANLRDCLRSKIVAGYSPLASWHARMQIAADVAKGLEYLHHLSAPAVIHKYIDSRNILVGNDLRAKIAHVGIAQLTGEIAGDVKEEAVGGEIHEEISGQRMSRSRSLKIHGIHGYMPPEYATLGELSAKYDVYSFGVVLSEILSGKEAVTPPRQKGGKAVFLSDDLQSIMSETEAKSHLRLWMDPLLRDSYPVDDAYRVAAIACSCMHPNPSERPEMCDIASKLQRFLISSQKWQASLAVREEILTTTLQPR